MDRLDTVDVAPAGRLALLWGGIAAAAAGVSASIAAVYVAMRDVMEESGGACAGGGPYVVANECSSGQIALLFGGVVALLVFMAVHAGLTHLANGPTIGWPAITGVLFFALGWSFIDLGLDPPRRDGTDPGWLVAGIVFWLMAVGFLAPAAMRAAEWLRRGDEPEPTVFRPAAVRAVAPGAVGNQAPPARPNADVPARLVLPPRGGDGTGGSP